MEIEPIAVSMVAVFDRDKRLLVGKRAEGDTWTLPGGKARRTPIPELPAQTAHREVWEETGISIHAAKLLTLWDQPTYFSIGEMRLAFSLFGCRYHPSMGKVDVREPKKHLEWSWLTARRVFNLVACGLLHPIILHQQSLEKMLNVSREYIDQETRWTVQEMEAFMADPGPCEVLVPREVRRALANI